MKIDKLKEKARQQEQREEWGKAMATYSEALARSQERDEPEIALHNRIGDLQVRIGDLEGAVENYETAIELYLQADLANNALAVCRKLERNAPGRPSVLLRMGQIRVRQGFVSDARKDFLAYAELQLAQGDTEEALRALEEFADLAPDDAEIRLFLADQLQRSDRLDDAVAHLVTAYRLLRDEGDEERAEAVRDQLSGLAPDLDVESHVEEWDEAEGSERMEGVADDLAGFETTTLSGMELDDPADGPPSEGTEDDWGTDEGASTARTPDLDEGERPEPGPLEGTVFDLDETLGDDDAPTSPKPVPMEASDGGSTEDESLEVAFDDISLDSDPEEEVAPEETEASALEDLPLLEDGPATAADEPLDLEDEDDVPYGAGTLDDLPMLEDDEGEAKEDPSQLPRLSEEMAADGAPFSVPDGDEEDRRPDPEAYDLSDPSIPGVGGESIGELMTRLEADPQDADAWRQLGVALFDRGREEDAREALSRAHRAYGEAGDPERAMRVVRELIFHEPDAVAHYQRLVEYAHRTRDRALMVPAFLELAEALERQGEGGKADAVYGKVLALDPRNPRARRALAMDTAERVEHARKGGKDQAFVSLGGLVLDDSPEDSFRWKVTDADPTGDEEADFARMLTQFKEKVERNMPSHDSVAHYDLGAAYKDMGLLDEAIGQFQRAIRARPSYLAAYEMVGQCFLEKEQPEVAIRTLQRALDTDWEVEDELLGIYYFLAKAHEKVGNPESAREFYERVFSLDINFKDVTERLRVLR